MINPSICPITLCVKLCLSHRLVTRIKFDAWLSISIYGVEVGGGGVFDGSGTGVSVGGSGTVAVPVIVEMTIAVLVGFRVRVAVGNTIGGLVCSIFFVGLAVGGTSGVRVLVLVGVEVGVSVEVGVKVGVALGGTANC